jgi:hypothetical protein
VEFVLDASTQSPPAKSCAATPASTGRRRLLATTVDGRSEGVVRRQRLEPETCRPCCEPVREHVLLNDAIFELADLPASLAVLAR